MLYIHIPFCDTKCPYCSFNSFVGKKELESSYLKALLEDFKKEIDRYKMDSFETIYIGGGTPSVLSPSFYELLFKELEPYTKKTKEITIEANPNSFTSEFAKTVYDLGIDRVSFGVQSLDEKKLSLLGRRHTQKEVLEALELAFKTGYKRVSADLIYGVKGDDLKLLQSDIEMLLRYEIEHISAYSLSIEEGSRFFSKPNMSVDSFEFGRFVKSMLESYGLKQYEVSNYGKNPSLHNQNYWRAKEYIGIGAGAVGFIKNSRITKQKNLEKYIRLFAKPYRRGSDHREDSSSERGFCTKSIEDRSEEIEVLSSEDLRFERLFMGLRSDIGVDLKDIKQKSRVSLLEKEGKLTIDKSRVFCKDYFLADEIALFLDSAH